MKVRKGFVSNSSSSSFIVTSKEFNKIKCPICKELLKCLLHKQKAQEFLDEHWSCIDWNDNNFNLKKNEIIYANHIPYESKEHKTLEKVLPKLNVKYMQEGE